MPTSATAADSNQSVNDRDKLSPSIQPPSSQHPQQNLAQADALLTELKQQQNSHNTNPEQARQRLAQTYLQLARDARQQKQWQQAEAFLAKSIEMRIDQIDDSELISPKAGDHSNKDLME